jgi:hypoxanthine phosphoribosyltransferase
MMREIILTREQIQDICKDLGKKLSTRLANEDQVPVFVGVMKGGLNFTLDLIKEIEIPIITDYVQISSYDGTSSTGIVKLKKDLTYSVKNKTVVLVDDVVDTGYSMQYLKHYLQEKYQPKEIIIVTLIDKQSIRKVDVKIDYCGMSLKENKFLVGYGLDYKELNRNIPFVYVPDQEEIDQLGKLASKNQINKIN